jgi:hypothetical protein
MFSEEGGWPFGEVKDNSEILVKEKQIEAGNPVRDTNIIVTELSKALGVTSLIVAVPFTCKFSGPKLNPMRSTDLIKRWKGDG